MADNIKLRFFRNTGIPEGAEKGDIIFNPQAKRISVYDGTSLETYGSKVENATFENSILTITKVVYNEGTKSWENSTITLDFHDVASAEDVTKVVGGLKAIVESQGTAITALQNTVGNASSGLVKDVKDLKTTVGDSNSGLVKKVADLEKATGSGSGGLADLNTRLTTAEEEIDTLQTNVATLQNDKANKSDVYTKSEVYNKNETYSKDEVDSKLSSAYKAQGSKSASQLTSPLLVAANEGYVYNLSDKLEITNANKSLFVEGVKSSYPAGTNVVVVKVGSAYKFDVIAGFVDLTAYAKTADQKTITDGLSDRIKTIEDSYVTKVKTTNVSSTSTKEGAHKNQLAVTPNVDTKGAVNITINETALDATLDEMATAISQAQSTAAAGVRTFGGEAGAITIDGTTTTNWEAKFKMDGKKLTATVNHDSKLDNYAAGGSASRPVYISSTGVPTQISVEANKAAQNGTNLVTSGAAYAAIADAQSTIQTNINNLNSINWVSF